MNDELLPEADSAADRLAQVRARIAKAVIAAGREPESVELLAVSKTQPSERIAALADAGQRAFGENYLQEAEAKLTELANRGLEWHFIGRIQSNKTRSIAACFDWVHTLDRDRIARRLNDQRPGHLPPLNVLIEVNVSGEATKGGIAPAGVAALADIIGDLPRLSLRGLMCLPAPTEDPAEQRAAFAALRQLAESLAATFPAADTLSMGTTGDFVAAIEEGSTMVRLGTALFGPRPR